MVAFLSVQTQSVSLRGAVVPVARPTVVRRSIAQPISAKYRGHGTDLSKVPDFQRHENDSGSPEAQIARMSARVIQLTDHLRVHKTDYSTRRGLMAVLSKRKQLLRYLRSKDKAAYERCINELGIRQLKAEV
ncbi:30S ribosomal protein S15 [Picochlorum sp. SENEW3]|nr:30S ribosomal protein S15 [Picochlorum sp. SENEW3]